MLCVSLWTGLGDCPGVGGKQCCGAVIVFHHSGRHNVCPAPYGLKPSNPASIGDMLLVHLSS